MCLRVDLVTSLHKQSTLLRRRGNAIEKSIVEGTEQYEIIKMEFSSGVRK